MSVFLINFHRRTQKKNFMNLMNNISDFKLLNTTTKTILCVLQF